MHSKVKTLHSGFHFGPSFRARYLKVFNSRSSLFHQSSSDGVKKGSCQFKRFVKSHWVLLGCPYRKNIKLAKSHERNQLIFFSNENVRKCLNSPKLEEYVQKKQSTIHTPSRTKIDGFHYYGTFQQRLPFCSKAESPNVSLWRVIKITVLAIFTFKTNLSQLVNQKHTQNCNVCKQKSIDKNSIFSFFFC